ncbi:unnamed protein product [Caenorhabditis bovis]|uniref:Uncharacterized protein n=1 Tax=Caenorhabditis bovis TaxID=2654633 RepID=A0A8S1FDN8_9PELO|nr:unnamed protein product [Caenorhabditis bovis]
MRYSLILLLLFGIECLDSTAPTAFGGVGNNEEPAVLVNASFDNHMNLHVFLKKNEKLNGSVTGFKIYYTLDASQTIDEFLNWNQSEVLTEESSHRIVLKADEHRINVDTVVRMRASVFINNNESNLTSVIVAHARHSAPKSPLIVNAKILHNSSVLISFVPPDDVDLVENYTISYKKVEDANWDHVSFRSDIDGKVLLDGLEPNRTYDVKMRVTGGAIPGDESNVVRFSTNSTALALIRINQDYEWTMDPQTSEPLLVKCTVKSATPATVYWKVNGVRVSVDSSFYTVTTTVHEDFIESTIRAKSRTRSASFSCVAANSAGDSTEDVAVTIKGPGSPPSEITLIAETNGYTLAWKPPSHPNGVITKYVVYYTLNREDPLSDWTKIDLDGSEKSVRIESATDESFYARVQAATELGPGIISDVVAMERDTQPISLEMEFNGEPAEHMKAFVVDPDEPLSLECRARGKPRPSIAVAISDRRNASRVEVDVWHRLPATSSAGVVVGVVHNVSVLTTKFVHCRAKNSAGSNYSTIELRVDKPGDAPTGVQVLSVNALDATVVWHSPQFPNLPITSYIILASKDEDADKSLWLQYESNAKETQINRMLLQTSHFEKSTKYYVCVRAKNDAGLGPISDVTSFYTLNGGPDGAPMKLRVFINEANQVIVVWKAPNSSTEVTGYMIYYTRDLSLSNDDYRSWQMVETSDESNRFKFDHSIGLKPKTFYRVRISAKNIHAEGPPSETVEFETAYSELPIPTDIKTEVLDDNTIHIRFTAVRDPDDYSKAIDNYRIELSATDDVMNAVWKTIKPKSVTIDELSSMVDVEIEGGDAIEKNRMYWVKVTARLENSAWIVQSSKPRWFRTGHGKLVTTVAISESPLIEKEPNLYEKLVLTCTGVGSPAPVITFAWQNRSIDNGTDGWEAVESMEDENTILVVLTRNSIRESGNLTCIGVNDEGNSTDSVEIRVLGPGSPPEGIKLVAYRNQINVTWMTPTLPNGEITKYIVYFTDHENYELSDWHKLETVEHRASFDAFAPNHRHFVKIQAVSQFGPGIISDQFVCTSDVLFEPLELEILAENIVDFEAEPNQNVRIVCRGNGRPLPTLHFKFGNSSELAFERVELADDGTFEATAPEVNSRRNLTVACRASNKYENVTISRIVMIKRPGEAPSNITWKFDENDDSLMFIDWKPIENPNGRNLVYNLYLSNFKTKVSGPPVKIPEIPLNVNVTLRISAENEYGEGEKSWPIVIPTPNGGPKSPPVLLSLHAQANRVHVTWQKPSKPNGRLVAYTIYFKTDEANAGWKTVEFDANTTMAVLDESHGLEPNRKYQLMMTARNELNEGPPSSIVTFDLVTFGDGDVIANFTAVYLNETIVINFEASPNFKNYHVYIRETTADTFEMVAVETRDASDDTIALPNVALKASSAYKLKLAGVRNTREGPISSEVDVQYAVATPPTPTVTARRNIVKEPPL